MSLFLGTLIAFALCGLALGLGVLLGGAPIEGGCGRPGGRAARCAGCPNRERLSRCAHARRKGSSAS